MSDDENGNGKYPKYTVRAGAGHLDAMVEAEDAKTAYELWEKAINKMVKEVEGMSEEERNQIGLQ